MMRPLEPGEIVFGGEPYIPPKLIKKPKKKKKQTAWHCCKRWWQQKQHYQIWFSRDPRFPFKRDYHLTAIYTNR